MPRFTVPCVHRSCPCPGPGSQGRPRQNRSALGLPEHGPRDRWPHSLVCTTFGRTGAPSSARWQAPAIVGVRRSWQPRSTNCRTRCRQRRNDSATVTTEFAPRLRLVTLRRSSTRGSRRARPFTLSYATKHGRNRSSLGWVRRRSLQRGTIVWTGDALGTGLAGMRALGLDRVCCRHLAAGPREVGSGQDLSEFLMGTAELKERLLFSCIPPALVIVPCFEILLVSHA